MEGVFYFPLPQDASISGFGMWIGDKLVEADIGFNIGKKWDSYRGTTRPGAIYDLRRVALHELGHATATKAGGGVIGLTTEVSACVVYALGYLSVGDPTLGASLGVAVAPTRWMLSTLAGACTALVVAQAGSIGFVGLMVAVPLAATLRAFLRALSRVGVVVPIVIALAVGRYAATVSRISGPRVYGASGTLTMFVPFGTAPYISPEQLVGIRNDPRSDLFATGVLLYFFSTGVRPFGESETLAGMRRRLWRDPVPPRRLRPDYPPWLQEVVLRCLEKKPGELKL